ncbi:hypothetical protein Back2_21260 [Nocardioides baekrokdamisoli]|uniref:DUF4229 domain-containing protein n=1 Tax=Nocardioides baekrokdamisoli TaxID=1804624 RepID=A0A3G9J492_9ACTN|nr:DUF4229 domain-containing protein [Nocardioides baekrokdamisoli]BBH17839.1 hypothetical protein Back2_21260 [Nocardioides baekrokdamisoli]
MKSFWTYTGLRILLFVATFAVVAGVWAGVNHGDVNWFWALIVSFLASFLMAYPLLMRQREEFAARLQVRGDRMVENMRSGEDD